MQQTNRFQHSICSGRMLKLKCTTFLFLKILLNRSTSFSQLIQSLVPYLTSRIFSIILDDTRKTMQLAARLPLAVGCRYELSAKVNVSDGLANGAGGVIKQVRLTSFSNLTASGIVWILFDDQHVGTQARADYQTLYTRGIDARWTPLQPIIRQFQAGRSHNTQIL